MSGFIDKSFGGTMMALYQRLKLPPPLGVIASAAIVKVITPKMAVNPFGSLPCQEVRPTSLFLAEQDFARYIEQAANPHGMAKSIRWKTMM
jgi:hypothetical protein